jgi:hypothetical protein
MSENIKVEATAEGERKDKHIEVPDARPTMETFDLDEFVQQNATVPVVKVTVFLDADAGKQLFEAQQRRDELNVEMVEVNNSTAPKLAVGETNPKMVRLDQIQREVALLETKIAGLGERVRSSALLIELQVTDHKMPERVRQATAKALNAAFSGEVNGTEQVDEDVLSEKSMTAMLAQSTVRITKTDGKTIVGPITFERMENLRNSLIVTEATKLVQGLYEALNLNVQWMANIDAGFPGRDADVAG